MSELEMFKRMNQDINDWRRTCDYLTYGFLGVGLLAIVGWSLALFQWFGV